MAVTPNRVMQPCKLEVCTTLAVMSVNTAKLSIYLSIHLSIPNISFANVFMQLSNSPAACG